MHDTNIPRIILCVRIIENESRSKVQGCFVSRNLIGSEYRCSDHCAGALNTCLNPPSGN